MKAARVLLFAAFLAVPLASRADDAAPALPAAGAADVVDAPPRLPPIAVRHDPTRAARRTAAPVPEAAPLPPGGTSVEIQIPPQPRENPSPHFVFTDVTDRPAPAVKALPERKAAVEAVRQSLRRGGAKRR